MFLLIIFLALITIGLLFMHVFGKRTVIQKTDEFTKYDAGYTTLWIGIVFGVISLFINFSNYSRQVSSFESARNIKEQTKILQTRYDSLYKSFSLHLSEEYPALEKEIFGKLALGSATPNLQILLTKYPELKSSITLCKLVDETKLIADDMYQKKLDAQDLYEKIRYRSNNPWILMKKRIPDDIYNNVYIKTN